MPLALTLQTWHNLAVSKHNDNDNRCDLADAYTAPGSVLNGCNMHLILINL